MKGFIVSERIISKRLPIELKRLGIDAEVKKEYDTTYDIEGLLDEGVPFIDVAFKSMEDMNLYRISGTVPETPYVRFRLKNDVER